MKNRMRGTIHWAALAILAFHGDALALHEKPVEIHGFVSQGYLRTSDNQFLARTDGGSFDFTEAGLNVSADLAEQLRVGLQLFSRRLGHDDDHDVQLDWAYGDYRWRDELGFRLGRVKTPIGLYNQLRDYDFLRTPALLPQSIYSEEVRDITVGISGGGVYGHLDAGGAGSLDYEVVGGTISVDGDSKFIRNFAILANIPAQKIDVYIDYAVASALRWNTPLDGLRFGLSHYTTSGESTFTLPEARESVEFEFESYVLSAEYVYRKLTLASEYSYVRTDFESALFPPDTFRFRPEGYYGLVAYRLSPRFEVSLYYSEFYRDRDDRSGRLLSIQGQPDHAGWQKDLAATLRVDLTEQWIIKFEIHHMDGTAMLFAEDHPDGAEKDWQLYVVKTSFSF